jgi:predicted AAA+ superfamily ATPase
MFTRENYLHKMAVWIDKPLIKVITGQRRVGKSMFVFQMMDFIRRANPEANCIYMNTENEEYQHIRTYKDLQKEINERFSFLAMTVDVQRHCEERSNPEDMSTYILFHSFHFTTENTNFREFGDLLSIKDNFPKMVVTMDELAGTDYQGIRHVHILDFLLERCNNNFEY